MESRKTSAGVCFWTSGTAALVTETENSFPLSTQRQQRPAGGKERQCPGKLTEKLLGGCRSSHGGRALFVSLESEFCLYLIVVFLLPEVVFNPKVNTNVAARCSLLSSFVAACFSSVLQSFVFFPRTTLWSFCFSEAPDCVDSMHSWSEPADLGEAIEEGEGEKNLAGTNLILFSQRT